MDSELGKGDCSPCNQIILRREKRWSVIIIIEIIIMITNTTSVCIEGGRGKRHEKSQKAVLYLGFLVRKESFK